MENYNLYLKLANSEVRAMESYNNFNIFLNDGFDSVMEGTSTFKESLNKMKERVIKFFKMIFGYIQRFFIKIFGAGERLGHKKAISDITTYASATKLRIYKIVEDIVKYLMKNNNSMETIVLPEGINKSHEFIKEDTEKIKETVHNIISTHKDKHEYSLISKSNLEFINKFTKECEDIVEKTLYAISKENPTNELQHKFLSALNTALTRLMSTISEISSTIIHLTQSAMWNARVEDNETKLKHPINVEIED